MNAVSWKALVSNIIIVFTEKVSDDGWIMLIGKIYFFKEK